MVLCRYGVIRESMTLTGVSEIVGQPRWKHRSADGKYLRCTWVVHDEGYGTYSVSIVFDGEDRAVFIPYIGERVAATNEIPVHRWILQPNSAPPQSPAAPDQPGD